LLDTASTSRSVLPAAAGASKAVLTGSLADTDTKDVKKAKVVPRG
jgi:hypothetical protein